MDDQRFDRLAKALAAGGSRRSVLRGLLGLGGAAAVLASRGAANAACALDQVDRRGVCLCKATGRPPGADGHCPCPNGTIRCNGECVDFRRSLDHCGACGNACPAAPCQVAICRNGVCATVPDAAANGAPCDGGICCDGACQECCGADASTCSADRCQVYACSGGQCFHEATIICLPPVVADCYDAGTCNPATGACDRTYLGDDTTCGPLTQGVSEGLCCGGQCISRNESNCAACGDTCDSGFACVEGACRCDDDADCGPDAHCDSGVCVPGRRNGVACTDDSQCASGFCTDDVCCNERCDGDCRACNRSGFGQQPGVCSATGGDFAGADACGANGDQTCCHGKCCAEGQRCGINGQCCDGTGCGGCAALNDCGEHCTSPAPVPCGECQVCGAGGACEAVTDGSPCGEFGADRCCKGQCCNLGEACTATGCAATCGDLGCSACEECPLGTCVPKPGLSGHVCGTTCCPTGVTSCCGDICCAGDCCDGTCCPAGELCCTRTEGVKVCLPSNRVCDGQCISRPVKCCGPRLDGKYETCEVTDTCCDSGFELSVCCPAHLTCGIFGCGSPT